MRETEEISSINKSSNLGNESNSIESLKFKKIDLSKNKILLRDSLIGSKINLTEDSDRKYNQIILEMIDKFGDENHDFGKSKND